MASRRRKRVSDDLEAFIERGMRRLILRVWQVLTTETPVLTGFARAGWVPSTGGSNPGPSEGPLAGKGVRAELAAAQAQLASSMLDQNRAKANSLASGYKLSSGPAFIVNGVRHLEYLNDGTSAQAPALFVEAGIQLAVSATARELSGGA